MYFPDWFYKLLEPGEDLKRHGLVTEEEEVIVRKMIIVSLCCIQTNPSDRPSMNKAVEMLEGGLEALQVPPKPFLKSSFTRSIRHSSMTTTPPSKNSITNSLIVFETWKFDVLSLGSICKI